jgi:Tfp pilus assembly protein PilE
MIARDRNNFSSTPGQSVPLTAGPPPRAGARRSRRHPRGATLLEMGICVIIAAILLTLVVPSFSRVSEQNHVDAAAQYLRSIWSAQRVYWLENRTFATTLEPLHSMGLIDPKIASGFDGYFVYALSDVTSDAFTVTATRNGSTRWSGSFTITQDGEVSGHEDDGTNVLTPPDI